MSDEYQNFVTSAIQHKQVGRYVEAGGLKVTIVRAQWSKEHLNIRLSRDDAVPKGRQLPFAMYGGVSVLLGILE